jgi:hypothetical protein
LFRLGRQFRLSERLHQTATGGYEGIDTLAFNRK